MDYAYYKLTHPQVHKLRPHEEGVIAKADKERIQFNDFDIQLYEWKAGPSKGNVDSWMGRASGQFCRFNRQISCEKHHGSCF